jgi:hypothetical protein
MSTMTMTKELDRPCGEERQITKCRRKLYQTDTAASVMIAA